MKDSQKFRLKLLIVDDNQHDAEIIFENLFRKSEIDLFHKETLSEALEFIDRFHVDLVLLDINLPDTRGRLDGLKTIQEKSPHLPIVVVTGSQDQELVNMALENGATDFLIKGKYRKQRLNAVIQTLLQRIRADDYIEKVEKHLELAVQKNPVVIWSCNKNLDTYHSFGSFESIFREPSEENKMSFKSFLSKIGDYNSSRFIQGIEECDQQSTWSEQIFLGDRWWQAHIEVNTSDDENWYLGLITDITELKASEIEAKLQKYRAEQASRAKSEFLASVSHDLRTPLNGILGSMQILEEQDHNVGEELISNINNCAKTLLTLIDDVLDINSMGSQVRSGVSAPLSLYEMGRSCIRMVQADADRKKLHLIFNCEESVQNFDIVSFERLLKKLFLNLISNAVKYTEQGSVELKINLKENSDCSAADVQIEVIDTGIGMEEPDIDQIFDPYSRIDPAYENEGSKGLGLYICKKIVEGLNGTISVNSRKGEGSRFYINFRTSLVPSKKKIRVEKLNAEDVHEKGLKTILVVDDLKVNRFVLENLVKGLGYSVDTAESGKEALDILESKKIDLVFLDMRMPGMDGFQTVEELRRREKAGQRAETDVVAVSASVDKDYQEKCLRFGCDEFLPKPVLLTQLRELIERRL